ncbi:MAG: hypothetical protein N3B16_10495 [Candidatus Aminicenantes bacterium]|nr:hypothetical protein [Candidatus Aminicenantes bacterium]
MKKLLFWILALIITLGTAVYQKITGPIKYIEGKAYFDTLEIPYKLPRFHETSSDCPIQLVVPDENILAYVEYRPYNSDDLWTRSAFKRKGDLITTYISPLPKSNIIEYRLVLFDNDRDLEISIPKYGFVVMHWHHPVPTPFLILHNTILFFGLFLALLTGLEATVRSGRPWRLACLATLFLFLGGLVLRSIVEKYSSGIWWSGFPVGDDLFDNKMFLTFLGWLTLLSFKLRGEIARGWFIAASLFTLGVFLIPVDWLNPVPPITYRLPPY